MKYQLAFKPRAQKDLRDLPRSMQARVIEKLRVLTDDLIGDVKKLTNFRPAYRLRVGDYRVLFETEGDSIVVYRVVNRRDAYR
jgi:mRNA interferase RelE/StbE